MLADEARTVGKRREAFSNMTCPTQSGRKHGDDGPVSEYARAAIPDFNQLALAGSEGHASAQIR